MPAQFARLTLPEFAERLGSFRFSRRIDTVHMHHTWRPNHAMWAGRGTIEGMWRYHTQVNGWSDIAQHVTIDPVGHVWTGRDWNRPPASSSGFNGNAKAGPFMFEIIGDFDAGRDRLAGAQREAVIEVIARVQLAHGLPAEALRFHNALSGKTCPGNGPTVRYDDVLDEVRKRRAEIEELEGVARAVIVAATDAGARDFIRDDPADAEPEEEAMRQSDVMRLLAVPPAGADGDGSAARDFGASGERELAAAEVEALRPHVVNLSEGTFRESGSVHTTPADVDAIFDEHLPRWIAAARGDDREPLRIVLFAHGGLVAEKDGLDIARKHVDWWKENGVYPIYFVWETGLADAMRSVLESVARRVPGLGARDFWDYTTDPVVEAGCRALGGVQVWGAMKRSAELASAEGGGARYVAERLAAFSRTLDGRALELHAVGHSAGSIFHAHFVPAAREAGAPPFKSLQLLAPAIRVDTFHERLAGRVGSDIERLTLYTMRRSFEERDHCMRVYRKSLLYLIYNALEREPDAPILGLEMSIRADARLKRLLGLDGTRGAPGDVVWSRSSEATGARASQSTSHGGFDDDPATMNSVAARVLGADAPAAAYRGGGRRGVDEWRSSDEWLAQFDLTGAAAADTATPAVPHPGATDRGRPPARRGQRLALCVGINEYAAPHQLEGCVSDSRTWGAALERRGFDVRYLTNEEATHEGIRRGLRDLVARARAGDVVVFQFAGHGTEVKDLDGDEEDGTDEALVPYDFESGAFLLDDDLRAIFRDVPHAVNLTCFMDCCHSGTGTRLLGRNADAGAPAGRARYFKVTPELERAHERFRADQRARGFAARAFVGAEELRWVTFSACDAKEVAYENGGSGDFTRTAMRIFEQAAETLTHREFQRRLVVAFGERRRQNPRLDCAPAAETLVLLRALAGRDGRDAADGGTDDLGAGFATAHSGGGDSANGSNGTGSSNGDGARVRRIAAGLRDFAAQLDSGHGAL